MKNFLEQFIYTFLVLANRLDFLILKVQLCKS